MKGADRLAHLEVSLQQRVREANDRALKPLSATEISGIVREVVSSLTGDVTASDLKFYSEMEDLAKYIRHAKQEIAAIKPKDITSSHIPHATDELDAVVGATEDATNKIMDVCDTVTALAESCPEETKEQLIACTTRIFEACNFQDITGQRITKVVQTLKFIDTKVEALLKALGEELHHDGPVEDTETDEEKALLNGPQLPHNAIGQDEIDRLLSDM